MSNRHCYVMHRNHTKAFMVSYMNAVKLLLLRVAYIKVGILLGNGASYFWCFVLHNLAVQVLEYFVQSGSNR